MIFRTIKMFLAIGSLILNFFFIEKTFAQSTLNYGYTYVTNGTLNAMTTATNLIGPLTDDGQSLVTNIGFDFWFMGVRYTQFSVNSNGLMRLGGTVVGVSYNTNIGSVANTPLIAPFSHDLATSSSGSVKYLVTGSAPNRKLVVEWGGMLINYSAPSNNPSGQFQVVLSENTGKIEIIYGGMIVTSSVVNATASVGFQSSNVASSFASINLSTLVLTRALPFSTNNLGTTFPNTLNANSTTDGSRKIFGFTPPVPNDPASFLASSPTSSTMNLTWTDNASNENGYVIYRSDDGGSTYSFVSQTAANSTSFISTGLTPSTTYYWKVCAVSEGALSTSLTTSGTTLSAGACISVMTGNWSVPATWACGRVPTAGDVVTIDDGHVVTVDVTNAVCYGLNIGKGLSGVLTYDNTARTLTVGADVTISSGASLQVNPSGTQAGHIFAVGGNLRNDGTLDLFTSTTNAIGLRFTGSSSASFSGLGATTDIYQITVNKGSSIASILELNLSNFTVRGASSGQPGFLFLTNGMFKLSGTFSGSNPLFTLAAYSIGATTGFWLNNSNFTVTGQSSMVNLFGKLRIDAGTYTVGTGIGHDLGMKQGGDLEVNGGILNVTASIYPYTALTYYYTQNGGTVNVATVGNIYAGYASFHLDANCVFKMTNGKVVIRNPNSNTTASAAYDYLNLSGMRTITGGVVQFGDPSTVGIKQFNVSGGYFPGLSINNSSGNHKVNLSTLNGVVPNVAFNTVLSDNTYLDAGQTYGCDGIFNGDILISSGAIFHQGSRSHTWRGNLVNNGTFTSTGGTVSFAGSSNQSIGGTSGTTFFNLTNSNTSTGLTLNASISIGNNLTMQGATADIFLNGYNISLGSTATLIGESNTDRIYGTSGSISTTRLLNAPSALNVAGLGVTLTTASNLGATTITRTHNSYANTQFTAINRNFLISPATNSGLNATVTVQYFDNEITNLSIYEPDFVLWRSTDLAASWVNRGGNINPSGNSISLSNIDAFSLWTIAPAATPLPVTLVSFEAYPKKGNVEISWRTANEINNEKFIVERSLDGKKFEVCGEVAGSGNSNHPLNYRLTDVNWSKGVNYYRLTQIDFNGASTQSKIVSVNMVTLEKDLVKIVNSLGQVVDSNFKGLVFDVYSDGTIVRRIQ